MIKANKAKQWQPAMPRAPHWHHWHINALLIVVTLIWGTTFLVIQQTTQWVGPFTFLTLRFAFATLTMVLLFPRRLARLTRVELLSGSVLGLFLFAGFALQTLGLQYTTTSKVAFITGLYVPLVPLFGLLLMRQRPAVGALLGVGLSFGGLTLLSLNETFELTPGPGELLTLGCAIAISLHIISVSKFAPRADALNLAAVQIALVTLLSLVAIPLAGEPWVLPSSSVWLSTLFMGTVATAFCLSVVNRVQQYMSSTRAVLIYALEPVWAGIFGYLIGERLGMHALLGCGLILLGIIASELRLTMLLRPGRRSKEQEMHYVTDPCEP